jgi:Peptidase family M28
MIGVEDGFSMIFSILKITAKSDVDSIVTPHHIIEEANPTSLEKTVRDLSSFHTRHTESEYIDNVAYWLTEKLQSVCETKVYIQNFTHTSENTNNDDDNNDDGNNDLNSNHHKEPYSYNLKNIACEKPGKTNNTIMITAHYDSRAEDINDRTARAPGADDNASGFLRY